MKKLIILIIVLAAAGIVYWIVSGDKLENYYEEAESPTANRVQTAADSYRLLVGKKFPNTGLISTDGQTVATGDLLANGKVILFLDPGCSNCEAMTDKWTALLGKKLIPPDVVIGICFAAPAEAAKYHDERRLNFPLYCDTLQYFVKHHELYEFPLQLVVGQSLTIYESTYDPKKQVFADQLERWLKN